MDTIFNEIIKSLKREQAEHELFASLNDEYTPLHESKISAFEDSIKIVRRIANELWNPATEEPTKNGEYIVYCRRCRDGKETISSAKYCSDEWKISNAFDLIGWIPYSKLFDICD